MSRNTANYLISLVFSLKRVLLEHIKREEEINPVSSLLRLETLRFIEEKPLSAMRDIARHLGITPPSATSLVNSLVRAKQLKRVPDTKDRRVIRLVISPTGRRAMRAEIERISRHIREVLLLLCEKDRSDLARIFKKLTVLFKL